MQIIITGTNFDLNERSKEYVHEKIGSLDRFVSVLGESVEARVEIGRTTTGQQKGEVYRAECNLNVPGGLLRSEATDENLFNAIDAVKDEMQREIKKYKGKTDARAAKDGLWAKLMKMSPFARSETADPDREPDEIA